MTKNYNTAIGKLPTPTRFGYSFTGWYTKASGGTKISTTTKVSKAVTYYAHWAKNYKVSFNPVGGKVSPASATKASGTTLGKLPIPTKKCYTFTGWYTKASGGTKIATTTKVSKNITYYAHWKKVKS